MLDEAIVQTGYKLNNSQFTTTTTTTTHDCEESEHEAERRHDGDEAVHLRMFVRRKHRILARNTTTVDTFRPTAVVLRPHERRDTRGRLVEHQITDSRLNRRKILKI